MRLTLTTVLILLAILPTFAETPDECAARLDLEIAVSTFEEAKEWWTQVEQECVGGPKAEATYDPNRPFTGIYGWAGEFVFCVMSPSLNIRHSPAGIVVDRFNQGHVFTVDLASQTEAQGYIWAKHDKGWSALFAADVLVPNSSSTIDEFTHPRECPTPTPTPRPTATRATRTTSTSSSTACQARPYRSLMETARRVERDVRRAEAICSTEHIMVKFKLQDNLFFGPLTVSKHAMYDLLCELRIDGYGITFEILADFIDTVGNESESRAILARFEAESVRRINCNSAAGMIQWEALAETWWVHPGVN